MTPFDIAKEENSSNAKEIIEDNNKIEASLTDLMKAARVGDYDAVEYHAQNERKCISIFQWLNMFDRNQMCIIECFISFKQDMFIKDGDLMNLLLVNVCFFCFNLRQYWNSKTFIWYTLYLSFKQLFWQCFTKIAVYCK